MLPGTGPALAADRHGATRSRPGKEKKEAAAAQQCCRSGRDPTRARDGAARAGGLTRSVRRRRGLPRCRWSSPCCLLEPDSSSASAAASSPTAAWCQPPPLPWLRPGPRAPDDPCPKQRATLANSKPMANGPNSSSAQQSSIPVRSLRMPGCCSSLLPSTQLNSRVCSKRKCPKTGPKNSIQGNCPKIQFRAPNAGPPRCAPGRAPPLTPKFNQGPRVPASALRPR